MSIKWTRKISWNCEKETNKQTNKLVDVDNGYTDKQTNFFAICWGVFKLKPSIRGEGLLKTSTSFLSMSILNLDFEVLMIVIFYLKPLTKIWYEIRSKV